MLELMRDMIRFNQIVGEGQNQAVIDRDIIVPDIKPDIASILSTEGKINITSKNVEQDRVAVEGVVNFDILYTAEGEPQPIYSMNQNADFSHYIDIPGAKPNMDSDVRCNIEHIEIKQVNGRKLNIQCVLNMTGKAIDSIPIDAVKEINGLSDVQVLTDVIVIDDVVGENSSQAVIRGTIEIPADIPQAGELLKYRAMVHKKDVKVEEGKIVLNGSLFVSVLFSSKDEKPDVYKVNDDLVFSQIIEIREVMPGMICHADYSVDDIYAELKANDDGDTRLIDIEAVVGLKVKAMEKKETTVLIDAYAPSARIEAEKLSSTMDLYFGENVSQAVVKESLTLPQGLPEIEKVYDMICKPSVTECKVVDNKVVVEGIVGCDLIYLAKGQENKVCSFSEEVPFKCSIDMPGCKIQMKPEVQVDIEHMDFSMITKSDVEVKIIVGVFVKVYDKVTKEFVIKVDEIEEPNVKKPSITIYVVQPKDTLWSIAKRYFTTVDTICRINEIADSDNIAVGTKLIIPRKM